MRRVFLSLAEPVSLADQVVTATRTAQTASQSLAAVSVIDREDIERSQARSVLELLRQVPGVSLANNGGFRQEHHAVPARHRSPTMCWC